MDKTLQEYEEDLEHAYWRWRTSFDMEGHEIKKEAVKFLESIRKYQEYLNKKGHKWM